MALNQINKLVWIVEAIRKAGRISFEELNLKWMDNVDLSGGEEMLKRTFHKWRYNILEIFGLNIECENGGQYRYYISNTDDLQNDSIESWLLSTYAVSNSLLGCKSIKNKIILEKIPSGVKYLDAVIDAIKQNRLIHFNYYNYKKGNTRWHYVKPLCIKLFRQRWYLVGRIWKTETTTVFCLDRIKEFRLSSHTFQYPEDFEPNMFFDECFGVIVGAEMKTEKILLKVSARQANYLRDLPMHSTQKEIERQEDHSIFELTLRPTFDFKQEILWNGDYMEVLAPEWLRKDIADKINRMHKKYQ